MTKSAENSRHDETAAMVMAVWVAKAAEVGGGERGLEVAAAVAAAVEAVHSRSSSRSLLFDGKGALGTCKIDEVDGAYVPNLRIEASRDLLDCPRHLFGKPLATHWRDLLASTRRYLRRRSEDVAAPARWRGRWPSR